MAETEHCGTCSHCSSACRSSDDKLMAQRLDAWTTAFTALDARSWGQYQVDAGDVMTLALFLSGCISSS
jgi:polyferredoxin